MSIQKTLRRFSHSIALIAFGLLIFLVSNSAKVHPPIKEVKFTGEELFRGIFFAQGPVAQKIAILQSFDLNRFVKNTEQKNRIANIQNQLYEKVLVQHPEYLAALEAEIYSRNQFQIKEILALGTDLLDQLAVVDISAPMTSEKLPQVTVNDPELESIIELASDLSAEAVAKDKWILLPVCVIHYCDQKIVVPRMSSPQVALFHEQLAKAVSKI